LQRVSECK
jgi:hypothetical protein